jgi:hypothetical protein
MKPRALSENKFGFTVTNTLSCSTSPAAVRPNPLTTAPVPFRNKARPSRAAFLMPNDGGLPPAVPRRSFRSDSVPPSLRLRFTFPFAEPQAEASVDRTKTHAHSAQPDGRDFQIAEFALLHE